MTGWSVADIAAAARLQGHRAVDVYGVWDELTDYARHPSGAEFTHVPVLLEFAHGGRENREVDAASALEMLQARLGGSEAAQALGTALRPSVEQAPRSAIHTAIVPIALADTLQQAIDLDQIARCTLGARCRAPVAIDARKPLPEARRGARLDTLGVIDDGCCLAHEAYRDEGGVTDQSRVLALWDQEPRSGPVDGQPWTRYPGPDSRSPYPYGVELAQADVDTLLRTHAQRGERGERALYGAIARPLWGRPDHTHGARVLHLLAGPRGRDAGVAEAADASRLPVIFVQLPEACVEDTSGDSIGVHVVDGARYIVARTRDHARRPDDTSSWSATIAISLGSIAGPHDGTSMAERALADLARADNVQVVVAAGNAARHARVHGQREVSAGQPGDFFIQLPPGCTRDTFVEFWLPDEDGCGHFAFTVESPAGHSATARIGEALALHADGRVQAALIGARRAAQGERGTLVLLAIRPTAPDPLMPAPPQEVGWAPFGGWRVTVSSDRPRPSTVHAWVERDDIIVGARLPQRTRLDQAPGEGRDDSYINDDLTLASFANTTADSRVVVAGGYVGRAGTLFAVAAYCGSGPLRDGSLRPMSYACSDRSASLGGVAVPGFHSGTRSALNGTSAAAPQVARYLIEQRLTYGPYAKVPKVPPLDLRRQRDDTRKPPPTGPVPGHKGAEPPLTTVIPPAPPGRGQAAADQA